MPTALQGAPWAGPSTRAGHPGHRVRTARTPGSFSLRSWGVMVGGGRAEMKGWQVGKCLGVAPEERSKQGCLSPDALGRSLPLLECGAPGSRWSLISRLHLPLGELGGQTSLWLSRGDSQGAGERNPVPAPRSPCTHLSSCHFPKAQVCPLQGPPGHGECTPRTGHGRLYHAGFVCPLSGRLGEGAAPTPAASGRP